MRQRKENNLRTGIANQIPVECQNLRLPFPFSKRKLWMQLLQRNTSTRRIVGNTAEEERLGLSQARVREQQSRQFPTGVPADSSYSCANRRAWLLVLEQRGSFELSALSLHVNQ